MSKFLSSVRGRRPLSWFFDNPLLIREMRRRMRGRSFTWSLVGYLIALGLVSCFLMYANYPAFGANLSTRDLILKVGRIGSTLFQGMCFVEGVIAIVVTPMITAGLATAEKEKDTFEFLQVTTLAPGTFVLGCLLTTGLFLLMVFACTLPILGLTFIFGGVSLSDILLFNGMLFLLSLAISSWGIFNSTSYKRSRTVMGSIALSIAFFFFLSVPFFAFSLRRLFGYGYGYGSFGLQGPALYTAIALIALIAALSVASARRLYEPNNRLFSYKQFIAFFALLAGLILVELYNRANPGRVGASIPDDQRKALVMAVFAFLWILMGFALLIFSAGRVERGDELWRLRFDRPAFRGGLDAGLVYAILGALSVASLLLAIWITANPSGVSDDLLILLGPALTSLFLIYAICRLLSVLTQTRNRAALGLIGILFTLWVLIPLMGFFVGQVAGSGQYGSQAGAKMVSELMTELSPAVALFKVIDKSADDLAVTASAVNAVLAVLILLPTLLQSLRSRLYVSYDYSMNRPLEAETA